MNILGAEIFVFHGNRDKTPVSPEFYIERYSKLCMLGKSFGITVAHENVERCQARSLDFIKSLLALDDSLKFTLDIKQCIRSGENPFRFAEEIGKNMGFSKERIRQIENIALRKLKDKNEISHLKDYLN